MKFNSSVLILALSVSMAACTIRIGSSTASNPEPQPAAPSGDQNGQSSPNPDKTVRTFGDTAMDEVTVQAHFREAVSPTMASDTRITYVLMNANLDLDTVSPKVSDQIQTRGASSKKIVSPVMDGCEGEVEIGTIAGPISTGTAIMDGLDASGKSACQDFFKEVARQGIIIEYSNAPFLNSPSKVIKKLTVIIIPKRP